MLLASVPDHQFCLCTSWFLSTCCGVVFKLFCLTFHLLLSASRWEKQPANMGASGMCFPVDSLIPPPVLILPFAYPQLVRPLCGPNPVTDFTVSWIMSSACPLIVLLFHKEIQEQLSVSVGIFHLLHLTLDLYIYIQIQWFPSVLYVHFAHISLCFLEAFGYGLSVAVPPLIVGVVLSIEANS